MSIIQLLLSQDWEEEVISDSGEVEFTSSGSFTWTVPDGITSVSAVVIGAGGGGSSGRGVNAQSGAGGGGGGLAWSAGFDVTPGETLDIVIGSGGAGGPWLGYGNNAAKHGFAGNATQIKRGSTVLLEATGGGGGQWVSTNTTTGGAGGSPGGTEYGGGGVGGAGYRGYYNSGGGGGGGAGGYTGNGGEGYYGSLSTGGSSGTGGGGGGGGGNNAGNVSYITNNGGGVGLLGQGANGAGGGSYGGSGGVGAGGKGGSLGSDGTGSANAVDASAGIGTFGGGGGGVDWDQQRDGGPGANGAARIIWGPNRAYPSTGIIGEETITVSANTATSVDEGQTLDLELIGTNIIPGSPLIYTISGSGIDADDFGGASALRPDNGKSLFTHGDYAKASVARFAPSSPNVLIDEIYTGTTSGNTFGIFTYEFWVKIAGQYGAEYYVGQYGSSRSNAENDDLAIYRSGSYGQLNYFYNTPYGGNGASNTMFSTSYFSNTAWNHVCVQRESSNGTSAIYVNGTRTLYWTYGRAFSDPLDYWLIGDREANPGTNNVSTWGWFSNCRLSKGLRYPAGTTSITVPTSPFDLDEDTIFLQRGTEGLSGITGLTWTFSSSGFSVYEDLEENPFGPSTVSNPGYLSSGGVVYGKFNWDSPINSSGITTASVGIGYDVIDATENETATVEIKRSVNGPPLASHTFAINDVSQSVTISTPTSIPEASTVNFNIEYSNFPNGYTVYWDLEFITASTADFGELNYTNTTNYEGSFTVNNANNASVYTQIFSLAIAPDWISDGGETFRIRLWRDAARSIPLHTSQDFSIDNVTPSLTITNLTTNVYEGDFISFTLNFTNARTENYWLYTNPVSNADYQNGRVYYFYGPNNGILNVGIPTYYDLVADTKTFTINVWTSSAGYVLYDTQVITINDRVPVWSSTIAGGATTFNEGDTIGFELNHQYVPPNTTIYWTVGGTVTASDLSTGSLSGTVLTTGNLTTVDIGALAEGGAAEANETMFLEFRTGSSTGPVVATSPTVTIVDAAPPASASTAEFKYFAYGSHIAYLYVRFLDTTGTLSGYLPLSWTNNSGQSFTNQNYIYGQQHYNNNMYSYQNNWLTITVDTTSIFGLTGRLVFENVRSSGSNSDMQIDAVKITDASGTVHDLDPDFRRYYPYVENWERGYGYNGTYNGVLPVSWTNCPWTTGGTNAASNWNYHNYNTPDYYTGGYYDSNGYNYGLKLYVEGSYLWNTTAWLRTKNTFTM